jgi:dihydroxy-acid dehydratase
VSCENKCEKKQACSSVRKNWKQVDSLRMGMDWDEDDINKPQILVDDVWGTTHPGNVHLDTLTKQVGLGVYEKGGKPSYCHVSDVCDGCAMGHDGMNYILLSRELIADMVEVHGSFIPFDGLVLVSGCDKSVPAHLKAAGRLDLPTIHVPGGSMRVGPNLTTSLRTGELSAKDKKGLADPDEIRDYTLNGTPSCGSCQVMGTASTMQCISEALGLALPGSALCPATLQEIQRRARQAGKQVMSLYEKGITARKILVKEAFLNALKVHAAISGSTNALIHLPTIAHEVGIEITPDIIDSVNKEIPYLTNILPSGKYPTEFLWYAGGVPMVQMLIKDYLDLNVLTVTGKTLGENLEDLEKDGFFRRGIGMLQSYGIKAEDVIRPLKESKHKGSLAILKGNLAPGGSVVKFSAVPKQMYNHVGPALVFDREEDCHAAIVENKVKPGSVLVIRYEGPKGSGMPEMYMTTDALVSDDRLNTTTAIVTDGRFSGFSSGPCIGHVTPEAVEGGPIALIKDNDLVELDIPNRKLSIVGINGQLLNQDEIEKVLEERRKEWKLPDFLKEKRGVLKRYCENAVSAMMGAYMK